jgi:DNA-directed RNA polymerase subunit M/transcription elongation factor TFIIS
MKFCVKCDNMYYICIDNLDNNTLSYYCRGCGHKDLNNEGVCVLNTEFKKGKQHFEHIVNKYTKLDPTLPRIQDLPCPNVSCLSNNKENSTNTDILYIRYDDNKLKYLYMCCLCDTVWTQ